jgi:hypothetical protein
MPHTEDCHEKNDRESLRPWSFTHNACRCRLRGRPGRDCGSRGISPVRDPASSTDPASETASQAGAAPQALAPPQAPVPGAWQELDKGEGEQRWEDPARSWPQGSACHCAEAEAPATDEAHGGSRVVRAPRRVTNASKRYLPAETATARGHSLRRNGEARGGCWLVRSEPRDSCTVRGESGCYPARVSVMSGSAPPSARAASARSWRTRTCPGSSRARSARRARVHDLSEHHAFELLGPMPERSSGLKVGVNLSVVVLARAGRRDARVSSTCRPSSWSPPTNVNQQLSPTPPL